MDGRFPARGDAIQPGRPRAESGASYAMRGGVALGAKKKPGRTGLFKMQAVAQ
jgi:hypothetical protein